MVNNDRIVPIKSMDFLSLVGTFMNLFGENNITPLAGEGGIFTVTETGTYLCNEPVKTLEIVTGAAAYFVADYGFEKITVNGEDYTGNEEVYADLLAKGGDGISLYAFIGNEFRKLTPDAPTASGGGQ